MTIFIAADHRGFEFKEKIKNWLKKQGYQIIDCGNEIYNPKDDYPDFAFLLAHKLISFQKTKKEALGIAICGSGIGVSMAVNRIKGVRCALGFDPQQIKHGRENDHINVLALPSDYLDWKKIKTIVQLFLKTKPKIEEKYLRRIKKLENVKF